MKSLTPGPMDTLLCLDVELGNEPGDYEICVLSAHEEAAGAGVSTDLLKAELSAGRHPSAAEPHLVLKSGSGDLIDLTLHDSAEFKRWLDLARGPQDDGDDDKIDHATARVPDPVGP